MTNHNDLFETGLRPMEYWTMQSEERIRSIQAGTLVSYTTGFQNLDALGRIEKKEIIVVAGRTSMGKTSLALQMAEEIAEDGDGCVAIFSAEMSGESLVMRMASQAADISLQKLNLGKCSDEEYEKFYAALRQLRSKRFWIDDSSSPRTNYMLNEIAMLKEEVNLKAMMFDFLELGSDEARSRNEEQRISEIMKNLLAIAKTQDIPVIVISQLSREVEKRGNKRPMLSDLRMSGMIEQLAHKVYFIMRPDYYVDRGIEIKDVPEMDKKGIAYVDAAKNRNGATGTVKLGFQHTRMRFFDVDQLTNKPLIDTGAPY